MFSKDAQDFLLLEVLAEYEFATKKYPTHPSLEHSFMILQEEVEELKQELYERPEDRSWKRIKEEATQVAAMALRLIKDYEKNVEEQKKVD